MWVRVCRGAVGSGYKETVETLYMCKQGCGELQIV